MLSMLVTEADMYKPERHQPHRACTVCIILVICYTLHLLSYQSQCHAMVFISRGCKSFCQYFQLFDSNIDSVMFTYRHHKCKHQGILILQFSFELFDSKICHRWTDMILYAILLIHVPLATIEETSGTMIFRVFYWMGTYEIRGFPLDFDSQVFTDMVSAITSTKQMAGPWPNQQPTQSVAASIVYLVESRLTKRT